MHPVTTGSVFDNSIEKLDPENGGLGVGISFPSDTGAEV
jgi:hypothetical protein